MRGRHTNPTHVRSAIDNMSQENITITKVEERKTTFGKTFLGVTAIQGSYQCFSSHIFIDIKDAKDVDNVQVEVEEKLVKGKIYKNIVGIGGKMAPKNAYPPPQKKSWETDKKAEEKRKQESILFFNSFNAAVSLLPHLADYDRNMSLEDLLKLVFKVADEIYTHNQTILK